MVVAGIDCGARNTKTVIMKDNKIIGKASISTDFDTEKALNKCLGLALKDAGLSKEHIQKVMITGAGKDSVKTEYMKLNEIKAIAKGAIYFFPNARTVVDVGAEESRVIKIDNRGNIVDFAVNEKCAAGAGIFIETMARALEVSVEEMGKLALKSKKDISINAQCVIFAESEVVSLIHSQTPKEDISRGIFDALASRIVSMVKKVGIDFDVVITGGVAYSIGFIEAIKKGLGSDRIYTPKEPEYIAATGAAIIALEK